MNKHQVTKLEADLFDIICKLHTNFFYRNKDEYKTYLALLDDNNEEYKSLTGDYYIEPVKCATLYSKLWEF